jgi:hypothetical protein
LKRIVIPVAAIAVLAIGGAWWAVLRTGAIDADVSPPAPRALQESAPARRNSEVVAIPGKATTVPVARTLPPASLALRSEIRDAPDLRAYYDKVKDLPDPTGERSYRLAEAIFECELFVDKPLHELSRRLAVTRAAIEDNPRRTQVLTAMVDRCKGFNGMGANLADLTRQLHERALAANYPAAIARSLRFEPAVKDLAKADETAVRLIGSSPDPDVLLETYHYLDARNGGDWLRKNGTDVQTWSFAWGLLQCDYGADCGPQSRALMLTCVVRGVCDATRMEAAILVQGGQAAVNNAVNMRDQLVRRIANQDWAGIGFIERSSK